MNVYTCTDHKGVWPVGTASVIVAESEAEARDLLTTELAARHLAGEPFTLRLLDTSKPAVIVLRDGAY